MDEYLDNEPEKDVMIEDAPGSDSSEG